MLWSITKLTGYRRWETEWEGPVIGNENYIFMFAYRNDRRYFPEDHGWIKFKTPSLSRKNSDTMDKIINNNSVFVHVRRGDYLSATYRTRFEGICTAAYYQKAIGMMKERHPGALFVVFSDDIEWCRENISGTGSDTIYVYRNTGNDSYLDMYLMAHCTAGVIANSTFSYWAARLVKKKDIIYPAKWINSKYGVPDIFEDDWTGL